MACEPTTLLSDAACYICGLDPVMIQAIRIRLLCAIRDGESMACDPATLMDEAKCILCGIPPNMMTAVEIPLLCSIASGGVAGAAGITCGNVDPVAAPTDQTKCAIYINKAIPNAATFWYWNPDTLAWISFIL